MKTKLFTLLAVIFCFGGMAVHAGGGLSFSAGPVNFAVGNNRYCAPSYYAPVARACYPMNYYYYPQPVYYSWGPTLVYYSSGTQLTSPFSNGAAVPTTTIYQVPAPVPLTQPVIVQPSAFRWRK